MQRTQDNRMPPTRWWRLAAMTPLAFGGFCLATRSWAPLQSGWPIILGVFLLAAIRQGANSYETRNERRRSPHV